MARGFGGTFGSGGTDVVKTLNSFTLGTTVSVAIWVYIHGAGGSGFGVLWSMSAVGCGTPRFSIGMNSSTSSMQINRGFTGNNPTWTITAPSLNFWHSLILTYDGSSTSNKPVVYIDGVSVAVTTGTGPSGSVISIVQPMYTGSCGTSFTFDGQAAHSAMWNNSILTAGEAHALANGVNPLFIQPERLTYYLPLDGINNPEPDLVLGGSGSITNTRLGTSDPLVQPLSRIRPLYDYQNDKLAAAGQILPFPWMQTSGGMRDMTGGMRN